MDGEVEETRGEGEDNEGGSTAVEEKKGNKDFSTCFGWLRKAVNKLIIIWITTTVVRLPILCFLLSV